MIRLLSLVGRATIVIAAALIIAGFVITGYVDPDLHPYLVAYGFERQLGALAGLAVGIIVVGIIFGPLATLYDIRDNMRRLVKLGDGRLVPGQPGRGDRPGPPSVRREPRLT
jgi:H+/gluconate symporter-like permease